MSTLGHFICMQLEFFQYLNFSFEFWQLIQEKILSQKDFSLWQESYETETIHDILELALVSQMHEGGAESSQHRSIYLTRIHIIKSVERIKREKIEDRKALSLISYNNMIKKHRLDKDILNCIMECCNVQFLIHQQQVQSSLDNTVTV